MESLRSSGDFRELLSLFNAEGVRYLIIGGFALAHYGRPRYTKDLDIWVDPADENPSRVFQALQQRVGSTTTLGLRRHSRVRDLAGRLHSK